MFLLLLICRIAQATRSIQGSQMHHARTRSSCTWTPHGEVHGETVTHNYVKRCLHKWILISVAVEVAMLEETMVSCENALYLLWGPILSWPRLPVCSEDEDEALVRPCTQGSLQGFQIRIELWLGDVLFILQVKVRHRVEQSSDVCLIHFCTCEVERKLKGMLLPILDTWCSYPLKQHTQEAILGWFEVMCHMGVPWCGVWYKKQCILYNKN